MKIASIFASKLRIGRLAMPVWLVAAAGLAIAASAGQAVGPILAGSVTGTVSVSAQQGLVLGQGSTISGSGDIFNAIIVANDEGTSFTAGIEMVVGDRATIYLDLDNNAAEAVNAIIELNYPAGIDLDVNRTSTTGTTGSSAPACSTTIVCEANIAKGTWMLSVPAAVADGSAVSSGSPTSADLAIVVKPKKDAKPGYYTITGRIVQIGG